MKPPMKQKVTAEVPKTDESGKQIVDKYGRPQTEKITSKARVQFKSQVIYDRAGVEHDISAEIDLPPGFNPPEGAKITYTTAGGDTGSGTIRAKEEILNYAGNRVFYRTVYVNG